MSAEPRISRERQPAAAGDSSPRIDLRSPLTMTNAFRFPIQNAAARRDLLIGGCLLLIPVVGFVLNMGYRLHLVNDLQRGRTPWPGWRNLESLLKHGFIASVGIAAYHVPAVLVLAASWFTDSRALLVAGIVLWMAATFTLPGFMTFYAASFDPREIWNPARALRRAIQGGKPYLVAWTIGVCGVLVSFLGLLAVGIGFAFSSVWFWQVAAFCFASVFSSQHGLCADAKPSPHRAQDRPTS